MGTAAYMSPEQARGKKLDKRTDVWAFACCLYEALTGRKVFEAEDVSLTLAEVMKSEPQWETPSHSDVPPLLLVFLKRLPRQGSETQVARYRRRASRDGRCLRERRFAG